MKTIYIEERCVLCAMKKAVKKITKSKILQTFPLTISFCFNVNQKHGKCVSCPRLDQVEGDCVFEILPMNPILKEAYTTQTIQKCEILCL